MADPRQTKRRRATPGPRTRASAERIAVKAPPRRGALPREQKPGLTEASAARLARGGRSGIDDLVRHFEARALSGEDLHKLCEGKSHVLRYRELGQFSSLRDALGRHRAMIVLYETRENYGHWVAVLETDRGALEVFDPYGARDVDAELEFIPKAIRPPPYLSRLIAQGEFRTVNYNKCDLQKFSHLVNTCGRWCGLRIALRDVPLKRFLELFIGQRMPADWLVTALTMFV